MKDLPTLRPLLRGASLVLLVCLFFAAVPVRVQAAVTSTSFYPATLSAYNTWINSTSNAKPAKTTAFPAGTSTVAFYFEYHGATPKTTTDKISLYDQAGTLLGTAGPFSAKYTDGLVMRKISAPDNAAFANGTYHAVLQVSGAASLTTSFTIGPVTQNPTPPSGAVTLSQFYPANKTAYDTWINSTSTARPPKTTQFPTGTSVVAFYFEYDHAVAKSTTYKITVVNSTGSIVGVAGPYQTQYADGLVMHTVAGPNNGAFPDGTYQAELQVAGATSLHTSFTVGTRVVSVSTFFAATKAAYDAFGAPNGPNPARVTSFPAGTTQVAFYFAYTKATPKSNTFQVIIRDQKGNKVATGQVHPFPYADGSQMLLFGFSSGGSFPAGSYRADLLVDGKVVNTIFFSVGVRPVAPVCSARDYIATCLEPSILRLQANLSGNMVAEGTGFVIQSDSSGTYVLTNKHVVDGATPKTMKAYSPDGNTVYPILAIARNNAGEGTAGDLAVIKLPPTELKPLVWGDSNNLKLLQTVITIGYGDAFDLPGPPTVAQGSISALNRNLGDGFGPVWIQHQSLINHGNSGGPLLDTSYHVVGVNTLTSPKGMQGLFFSIPSSIARPIADKLVAQLKGGQ